MPKESKPHAAGSTAIHLWISLRTRDRLKKIAKTLDSTMSDLARKIIIDYLDAQEERLRFREAEEERARLEREERQKTRRKRFTLDESPAEFTSTLPATALPDGAATVIGSRVSNEQQAAHDRIYDREARNILEAELVDDDREALHRAQVAVKRFKREFPLTHPSEEEIKQGLERHLRRVREEATKAKATPATPPVVVSTPTKPVEDPLLGKEIDVTKIKTKETL